MTSRPPRLIQPLVASWTDGATVLSSVGYRSRPVAYDAAFTSSILRITGDTNRSTVFCPGRDAPPPPAVGAFIAMIGSLVAGITNRLPCLCSKVHCPSTPADHATVHLDVPTVARRTNGPTVLCSCLHRLSLGAEAAHLGFVDLALIARRTEGASVWLSIVDGPSFAAAVANPQIDLALVACRANTTACRTPHLDDSGFSTKRTFYTRLEVPPIAVPADVVADRPVVVDLILV